MKTVTLGWSSSDQLSGVLSDLCKKLPDNKPLKELYELVSSGSDEPIEIRFNDNVKI